MTLSLDDCIHFALSMPITVLITGAEKPEFLRDKAALVRRFQEFDATRRQAIVDKVAHFAAEAKVEYYKFKELRA